MILESSIGWFNPTTTIQIESRKTRFILPTIDIEFTRPVLPAIRKPFCDTDRVRQTCLSYGHTEPNKIALPVVHIEPTGDDVSADINTDALGPATRFEPNCGPTYVFTKKTSIPTLCFRAKRADELAGEL